MSALEVIILGLLQGFTEFLPVSSSGHIVLLSLALGKESETNLLFTLLLHTATAASIVWVYKDTLWGLCKGLFSFSAFNASHRYVLLLLLSAVPIGAMGLLFKDVITDIFEGNMLFLGCAFCFTGLCLELSRRAVYKGRGIGFWSSLCIGLAQVCAIFPGVSRSGVTISCALLMGLKKKEAAGFSFLMGLVPILGAQFIALLDVLGNSSSSLGFSWLWLLGMFGAFVSGVWACRRMVAWVQKGFWQYFRIYCFGLGVLCLCIYLF